MSEIYKKLMDKKFAISIPSRERTHMITKRMGIWKYINQDTDMYPIHLFIREMEAKDYHLTFQSFRVAYHIMKNDVTIAEKRDYMIDIAKVDSSIDYLFIIDDDAIFYYRDEALSSKYTSKHEKFVEKDCFNKILYESMMLCNEEFPIVGLPLKQGSFGLKYMFPINIPIIRFVCYHVPTLRKENIVANGMDTMFMSDRYSHLSLLNKGYKSLSNTRWCVGDQGTGYKGGCSITRTPELQGEAARKLREAFPSHVFLKWKEDGVWGVRRMDCTIRWKKFLPEGHDHFLPMLEGLKLIGEDN